MEQIAQSKEIGLISIVLYLKYDFNCHIKFGVQFLGGSDSDGFEASQPGFRSEKAVLVE